MRISDWSSDVCSSDLLLGREQFLGAAEVDRDEAADAAFDHRDAEQAVHPCHGHRIVGDDQVARVGFARHAVEEVAETLDVRVVERSEEHTSELQSLMRISYAVFCLKKKTRQPQ